MGIISWTSSLEVFVIDPYLFMDNIFENYLPILLGELLDFPLGEITDGVIGMVYCELSSYISVILNYEDVRLMFLFDLSSLFLCMVPYLKGLF